MELAVFGLLAIAGTFTVALPARAYPAIETDRGRYLIVTSHCNNCHTAGYAAAEGSVPEDKWLMGNLPLCQITFTARVCCAEFFACGQAAQSAVPPTSRIELSTLKESRSKHCQKYRWSRSVQWGRAAEATSPLRLSNATTLQALG
jgi:hypothetical protein